MNLYIHHFFYNNNYLIIMKRKNLKRFSFNRKRTLRINRATRLKTPQRLRSTIIYNEAIARTFAKTSYYEAMGSELKNQDLKIKEKRRLSTSDKSKVTILIEEWREKGRNTQEKVAVILKNIFLRSQECATKKLPPSTHSNLMGIISNVPMLLYAYNSIKSNKGALTLAYTLSSDKAAKLNVLQRRFISETYKMPDGISLDILEKVSHLLKKGLYPWGTSRRIYFPKPGSEKLRPITIPPFMDRVVQSAIKMVLEAIYEPEFEKTNKSFGFRKDKGCHDAMISLTRPLTQNMYTALEGDITAAYDNLSKPILLKILSRRIYDKKFLTLMKNRLDYQYFDTKSEEFVTPKKGIPQGGIDSPYLWNIYLHEFDLWVTSHLGNLFKKINAKLPPNKRDMRDVYRHYVNNTKKYKLRLRKFNKDPREFKLERFKIIKSFRLLKHSFRKTSSSDKNIAQLKFLYARYADDWIILTNGSKILTERIKKDVALFLRTNLEAELSPEKTLVTNILKAPAHFLGYEVFATSARKIQRIKSSIPLKPSSSGGGKPRTGTRMVLKKVAGQQIMLYPDRTRLINRFCMKGICDKNGFAKSLPFLSCLEPQMIIERFNAMITGLVNYYSGIIYKESSMYRWIYILTYSCYKTLAQKYKISISKVMKRFAYKDKAYRKTFGKTINIPMTIKVRQDDDIAITSYTKDYILKSGKEVLAIANILNKRITLTEHFEEIEKFGYLPGGYPKKVRIDRSTGYKVELPSLSIKTDGYLETMHWTNLRTAAKFSFVCSLCPSSEGIEMHHLKHIRNRKYVLIPKERFWEQVMSLRNRKQIPLCRKCHKEVHDGHYRGTSLKLYDNRVIHIESYLQNQKGSGDKVYYGKTLEERGWYKKG